MELSIVRSLINLLHSFGQRFIAPGQKVISVRLPELIFWRLVPKKKRQLGILVFQESREHFTHLNCWPVGSNEKKSHHKIHFIFIYIKFRWYVSFSSHNPFFCSTSWRRVFLWWSLVFQEIPWVSFFSGIPVPAGKNWFCLNWDEKESTCGVSALFCSPEVIPLYRGAQKKTCDHERNSVWDYQKVWLGFYFHLGFLLQTMQNKHDMDFRSASTITGQRITGRLNILCWIY